MNKEHSVSVTVSTRFVKAVAPFCIKGAIVGSGEIAEISLIEAADLIRRRRAVVATEAEVTAAQTVVRSGTVDPGPDPQSWRAAVTSSFAEGQA
ncbi:hypothetical protein [Luteimonas sp. A482]